MKRRSLVLMLLLLMLFTAGCSKGEVALREKMVDGAVTKILVGEYVEEISELKPTVVFEEADEIAKVVEAFATATKIEGVLDVVEPDYTVQFQYEDVASKGYFLWLDREDKHGMVMDQADSHTGYKLTEEAVQQLLELIPATD